MSLPGIKGRVARECKGVVAGGEAGENSCVQIHRTIATSVLETQLSSMETNTGDGGQAGEHPLLKIHAAISTYYILGTKF